MQREGTGQWYWHIVRAVAVSPVATTRLVMAPRSPAMLALTVTHGDADAKKFPALCRRAVTAHASTPTVLHPSAQGCEERATLGHVTQKFINPEGVAAFDKCACVGQFDANPSGL
jgi:hypothetical protein